MRLNRRCVPPVVLSAVLLATASKPAPGLNLVLDYTHDTYFQTNPTAVAALEAAAADIEAVITSTLPPRVDGSSVTVGKATATTDWSIQYTNPANGAEITIDPVSIPADEYRIFVGVRPITQPGDPNATLGRGGASGIGLTNGFGIDPVFPSEVPQAIADLGAAVTQLEAEANANAGRGGVGPTLGTFNDVTFSGSLGGQNFSFDADIRYGLGVGNLWFDVDTDDNGTIDSDATLDDYWHWNHETEVPDGKWDFYSVALHEMVHTLGYGGTSESWASLISPSNPGEWLGPNLIAALGGSGEGAIDADDGAHLAEGLTGVVFGSTESQEAAMDPNITSGTRKFLTNLDVAVLADINWDVVAAPLAPGDFNGDGSVDAADYARWESDYGTTGVDLGADGNNDGAVDAADYTIWRDNLPAESTTSPLQTVPEPTSLLLGSVTGALPLVARFRRQ